jgi:hypothetical protein
MSETNPVELAEEAKKPGKFNILEVINERGYPEDEIVVYLNETIAYKAAMVKTEMEATDAADKKYKTLEAELDKLVEQLQDSKYVFSIKGISEGKREELYKLSVNKYPLEYSETKNAFTGEVKKEKIESEERDELFTSLLWSAHIVKITAPNGDVQENLSPEDADTLRKSIPLASNAALNKAMENIRAATAVFMMSVDEDFLAKS